MRATVVYLKTLLVGSMAQAGRRRQCRQRGHPRQTRSLLRGTGWLPSAGRGGVRSREESRALQGWSPLNSAVSAGHDDVVQRLLSLGADVAAQTSGGQTPLHYAVWSVPIPAVFS